jgi:hypothetical protein
MLVPLADVLPAPVEGEELEAKPVSSGFERVERYKPASAVEIDMDKASLNYHNVLKGQPCTMTFKSDVDEMDSVSTRVRMIVEDALEMPQVTHWANGKPDIRGHGDLGGLAHSGGRERTSAGRPTGVVAAAGGGVTLPPALRAGFTPLVRQHRRVTYEIIPDFKPETHLDAKARALYPLLWGWVEHIYGIYVEPSSRGIKPNSVSRLFPKGEPLDDGKMHLNNMRGVGHVSDALMFVLERWGDPRALTMLRSVWRIVLAPERLATGFGEKALKSAWTKRTVNGDVMDLEQPGVLRILMTRTNAGKPEPYQWMDMMPLEWDLKLGTIGTAKHALKDNLRHGAGPEYKLLRGYADAINTRLRFLSATLQPRLDWWAWGHHLRHPATARYTYHLMEWLGTGDAEQKRAADHYAKHLMADVEYITFDDGNTVAVATHEVQGLRLYKGFSMTVDTSGYQDVTYKREDTTKETLAHFTGASCYTTEYLAASARTTHLLVLSTGPNGPTIAATVRGNEPAEYKGKRGLWYGGKWYSSRWLNNRVTSTEPVLEVSRGMGTVNSAWATEHPEFEGTLEALNQRPDSKQFQRLGSTVG